MDKGLTIHSWQQITATCTLTPDTSHLIADR